jgi:hypothetical protein
VPALRGTPQSVSVSAASGTVAVPDGVVDGDFMMASISGFKSGGVTPATPVDPAGWTNIGVVDSIAGLRVNNVRTAWYWRIANAEPASYTFSVTVGLGDTYIDADIIAYRDVDQVTPFNLAGQGVGDASATPTSPDLGATTVDLCWHVIHFISYDGNMTGPPAGYTEDLLYDGSAVSLCHRIVTPAGATGARFETSSGPDGWTAWTAALQPAAGVNYRLPWWWFSERLL